MTAVSPAEPLDLVASLRGEDEPREALITSEGRWSYGELRLAISAILERLRAGGIRKGERVALVAAGSPEVIATILALVSIGATIIPIHPRLSDVEAGVVLGVARAERRLSAEDLLAARALLDDVKRRPMLGAAPSPGGRAGAPSGERAPLAIVCTSGTTGRPKGAVLSMRAFVESARASALSLGWRDDDRWLLCMPLAHVGGLSIVTRCVSARRTIVVLPRFDATAVLTSIAEHRVTLLSVVPTMLRALLDADTSGTLARPRAVLTGGAAASERLLDECVDRRVRALTTYGLTEACSQVTTQPPRDPAIRKRGSGAPLSGFEVRIAGEHGAPLPAGTTGRILVRGPAMFDGYVAGRGIDPARDPEGFFDTGDIGEIDREGHLHVFVRRTDLVVTGGENVYPAEVEEVLERCPGVRRALVFGVPDERWGQVVAAAIELELSAGGDALDLNDLLRAIGQALESRLAPHKRPRRFAFVAELPLTPSGKVDRKDALSRFGAHVMPPP